MSHLRSTCPCHLQEAELHKARSLAHSLQEELIRCQGMLQEQAGLRNTEVQGLQLSVAQLEQKLQVASTRDGAQACQQAQPEQQNAMYMVCIHFLASRTWARWSELNSA